MYQSTLLAQEGLQESTHRKSWCYKAVLLPLQNKTIPLQNGCFREGNGSPGMPMKCWIC